jgi:HEAT repeat protein
VQDVTSDLDRSLQHLADESAPLKPSTLFALSSLRSRQVSAVQAVWENLSSHRKRDVLQTVIEWTESMIDVDFSVLLHQSLQDSDAEVRRLALEGLWENEESWLVGSLLRLLKEDPEAAVRAAAASSLGRFVLLGEVGSLNAAVATRAEEALLEAYFAQHEPVEVKRRALEALAYSGETGVADLIEDAYYEGDEDLRLSAIFAMGRSADRRWRSVVIDELGSMSPAARYEAAVACGELELRDAVAPLSGLVDDPDREVCSAAIEALGKIGGTQALQALEACFLTGDEVLLAEAEEALERASWSGDEDLEILDDWSLAE